jgi:Domain of unknown function (DUF6265)
MLMPNHLSFFLAALLGGALGVAAIAPGQAPPAQPAPAKPAPAELPKAAPASDSTAAKAIELSWFAVMEGTWRGDMGGSFIEEIWSAPRGDMVMGCFRWCDPAGNAAMLEMLTIRREGDAIRLRLRHYSPTLVAKEEKATPVTLLLESAAGTKATFRAEKDSGDLASVSYEVEGDTLRIEIAFAAPPAPEGDKPARNARPPLRFELKKVGS